MPSPGTTLARGHLRLASVQSTPGAGRRLVLHLRALAAALATLWLTLVAWWAIAWALLPLLARRAPVGRKLRQQPPKEARVIPFQPRRRAVPR